MVAVIRLRIFADIMRRERLGPSAALAVFEDGSHHAFQQVGIVQQEQRG